MKRILNKVALIPGAARRKGASIAQVFIQEGAQVILTDILDEEESLANKLGNQATSMHLD